MELNNSGDAMQELARNPLSCLKVKPQTRQSDDDSAELRKFGESAEERQQSPVGALADGMLKLRVARAVTNSERPSGNAPHS
jgi:hypothetical protein